MLLSDPGVQKHIKDPASWESQIGHHCWQHSSAAYVPPRVPLHKGPDLSLDTTLERGYTIISFTGTVICPSDRQD